MNSHDLCRALRRCSKRDREAVLGHIHYLERMVGEVTSARRRKHAELEDLRIVVRDQRRHIANLEDPLLPYLAASGEPMGEQEAMQV